MVLAILLWGFVYSSHVNHDETSKGLTIKVTFLDTLGSRRISINVMNFHRRSCWEISRMGFYIR